MNRTCPNCGKKSISLFRVSLWSVYCKSCDAKVGIHPVWNFLLFVPLFLAFLFLLAWSFNRFGVLGAAVVTLLYIVVEFSREILAPLEVRALRESGGT